MEMSDLKNMSLEKLLDLYREKTKRPVIRSLKQKLDYLEARKIAAQYGGLPRNVTHQRTLVYSDDLQNLTGYYPAWAREMIVSPASFGRFEKGEDVVDACKDDNGRAWVYPSYCIPDEALGPNKALFVTPRTIIEDEKEVTIIADPYKDVVVLSDFPQRSQLGKLDKNTGVPLEGTHTPFDEIVSQEDMVFLERPSGAIVWPLDRGRNICGMSKNAIYIHLGYNNRLGVGFESLEGTPQISPKSLTLGQVLAVLSAK